MKILVTILAAAALTMSSLAIPQTFNQGFNPFFGAVGMQFEDFAGQQDAFGPMEGMKGQWVPIQGKKDMLKLAMSADVFGIPASEITAQKEGNKVQSYRVAYSAKDDAKRGKKQKTKLEDRVLAAIGAYTGQSASLTKPVEHKGVKIAVALEKNGDVFVTFTRAS
jgi:hypothetical protein